MGTGRVKVSSDRFSVYDGDDVLRVSIGVLDMPYPARLFVEGVTNHWEVTTSNNWDTVQELRTLHPDKGVYLYVPSIGLGNNRWRIAIKAHWEYAELYEIPKEIQMINMLLGD